MLNPKMKIFEAVTKVYNPQNAESDWWFRIGRETYTDTMVKHVTVEILNKISEVYLEEPGDMKDYLERTLWSSIQRVIWINFTGGTTAEYAADEVFKALGLTKVDA